MLDLIKMVLRELLGVDTSYSTVFPANAHGVSPWVRRHCPVLLKGFSAETISENLDLLHPLVVVHPPPAILKDSGICVS